MMYCLYVSFHRKADPNRHFAFGNLILLLYINNGLFLYVNHLFETAGHLFILSHPFTLFQCCYTVYNGDPILKQRCWAVRVFWVHCSDLASTIIPWYIWRLSSAMRGMTEMGCYPLIPTWEFVSMLLFAQISRFHLSIPLYRPSMSN